MRFSIACHFVCIGPYEPLPLHCHYIRYPVVRTVTLPYASLPLHCHYIRYPTVHTVTLPYEPLPLHCHYIRHPAVHTVTTSLPLHTLPYRTHRYPAVRPVTTALPLTFNLETYVTLHHHRDTAMNVRPKAIGYPVCTGTTALPSTFISVP